MTTIKNGVLADGTTTDIEIENGVITKLGESLKGENEIDVGGKLIIPGVIDIHVHFREPGGEQKEDWLTGSRAAAAGGVTTVVDMPNNNPAIVDEASLDNKRELAKKSIINYGFYLGATNDNASDIQNTKNIAGVKIYVGSSTGDLLVAEDENIEKLFSLPGIQWVIHAEDESIIEENKKKHTDMGDPAVHSRIRTRDAAVKAVGRVIALAKKANATIHICHVSTKEEVELIKNAKSEGVNVTCEVSPHHLFLNENAYKKFGNFVKVNPPLRTAEDNRALMNALRDGTIDIVATDHAPHTNDEKSKSYNESPAGIPEVQTSLPLLLNAVHNGELTLKQLVEITAEKPAQLLHIKNKGKIKVGYDADLTVVDLKKIEMLSKKNVLSKCGWSPYVGWELTGWPVMTFVNGNLAYDTMNSVEQYKGKEITYGNV